MSPSMQAGNNDDNNDDCNEALSSGEPKPIFWATLVNIGWGLDKFIVKLHPLSPSRRYRLLGNLVSIYCYVWWLYVYVMWCFRETSEVLVGLDFEGRRAMLVGSKKLHTFTGTDYPSPCRLIYTDIQMYIYSNIYAYVSGYLYIYKYTNPRQKILAGTDYL